MNPGPPLRRRAGGYWLVAALVFFVALAALPASVRANRRQVTSAVSLYEAGQLRRALAAFERALAGADNDQAGLRIIYLHLGILRAGAADPAGAQDAFVRLFAIDPHATLPEGQSPVVTEPFERARAARGTAQAPDLTVPPDATTTTLTTTSATTASPGTTTTTATPTTTTTTPNGRSSSILSSPWFWGGAAAFVAGALVAAIVVTSGGDKPYVDNLGVQVAH